MEILQQVLFTQFVGRKAMKPKAISCRNTKEEETERSNIYCTRSVSFSIMNICKGDFDKGRDEVE